MEKILSRFILTERDENRKLTCREHWVVMQTPTGSRIIQIERVEDFTGGALKPEEQAADEHTPRLIISDMTKGEFRLAVRKHVVALNLQGNHGVDLDKVDKAVQKTNADSRRQFGGLKYDKERVDFALSIYKKL